MKYNIKGTKKNPAVKILPIEEPKITEKDGITIIEGYANTKNTADRYGDVPTVYSKKRSFVYKLDEFKKNPVLLIDHVNRIDHLAGSITEIKEDRKGLYFKAMFSTSSHPIIAHARHIYKEGHAKGISIAGKFHFEDVKNPEHLTLAEIYEISLVAVPADPNSLAQAMEKTLSNLESASGKESKSSLALIQKEIDTWIDQLTKKTS